MKDMDMLNSIVPPQVKIYRRFKSFFTISAFQIENLFGKG
jgi:hypothetical protein